MTTPSRASGDDRFLRLLVGLTLCLLVSMAVIEAWPRPTGPGVIQMSVGGSHSCAVTSDGSVWCWGDNYEGQLGDGTTTPHPVPGRALGLDGGVAAVSAGLEHTCALMESGSVKCWGQGGNGELGDGLAERRLHPVDVVGLHDAVKVVAGFSYSCATTARGGVKCWGSNILGQLGDGTITNRSQPVDILDADGEPLADVVDVAVGALHTCAVTRAGGVMCWGASLSAEPIEAPSEPCNEYEPCSGSPVAVLDERGEPMSDVVAVAAGIGHTCVLTRTGTAKC